MVVIEVYEVYRRFMKCMKCMKAFAHMHCSVDSTLCNFEHFVSTPLENRV